MSAYSELIGSFQRTGSFPLEAEYVFTSKQDLDTWANNNQVYIHEGLVKTVEGKGLYYAVYNNSAEKFEFKPITTSAEDITLEGYQKSEDYEDLDLENSDSLIQAFEKLARTIFLNEEVIAESLNDLNKRLISIEECLNN